MDKTHFSIQDTYIIKGIAILCLLWHHLFAGVLIPPIIWDTTSKITILATMSKVCVSIFLFLSGYGLSASYTNRKTNKISFIFRHLKKLMFSFWVIYVLFVPLGFFLDSNPLIVYGNSLMGFKNFLLDFFGLSALFSTPTMNQTWWYMETTIVLYTLFPLIYILCKKIPVTTIVVSAIPMFINVYVHNYSVNNCREIYWVLPFVLGTIFYQKNILNNYITLTTKNYIKTKLIIFFILLIATRLRYQLGIIVDPIFAIVIILFAITFFKNNKFINKPLYVLGKHSANIFMFHSFIYYNFSWAFWLYEIDNKIFRFIALTVTCLLISTLIEKIKTIKNIK